MKLETTPRWLDVRDILPSDMARAGNERVVYVFCVRARV